MDDFYAGSGTSEQKPLIRRPEIEDALNRIILQSKIRGWFDITVAVLSPTSNPHVQRLHIPITCESMPVEAQYTVWIDGFELLITFVLG